MCERAMGLRGRGQPTATGSGRDPLDTSSRDSEDAGDNNGRVEGAKRLSSPQPHSPLCRCNIIRKLPPSSEFRTFILWKFFCTTGNICTIGGPQKTGSFSQFLKFCRANVGQMAKRKSQPIKNQSVDFSKGAGEGTRTHTHEAPDPKSGLATNYNTPA